MSEENRIGLTELIEQVKRELLTNDPDGKTDARILGVDSVELELQVTVKKEGKGGVKINVLSVGGGELAGGFSRDDIQKVKVKLSPLLNKEQLLGSYYNNLSPDKQKEFLKTSTEALTKGSDENLGDEY